MGLFLCGLMLGYLFHWFYINFILKDKQIIKMLSNMENEKLCSWAIDNKETLRILSKMVDDGFLDYKEAWEMYQREFDE